MKQAEQLKKQLKILEQFIAKGKAQIKKGKSSPQLERAWILWNDYCADIYLLFEQESSRYIPKKAPPFPVPPQNIVLGKKGEHNLPYTNYLAWGLGVLRNWPPVNIKDDLALQHTPADQSRLRAAVRIRRNESKRIIVKELEKND